MRWTADSVIGEVGLLTAGVSEFQKGRVRFQKPILGSEEWICIADSEIPVGERRVGMPLMWSPNEEEDRLLRQDWEELMDMIVLGEVEQISARHGQVMQLRPKAANNKALTRAIGRDGQPIMTLPRGFYLKIDFTHSLLQRYFALPT